MDNNLRYEVRLAKAISHCTYKHMASYLNIKASSFYCWLNQQYELSSSKEQDLRDFLDILLDRINA